jgi:hypothetical protein
MFKKLSFQPKTQFWVPFSDAATAKVSKQLIFQPNTWFSDPRAGFLFMSSFFIQSQRLPNLWYSTHKMGKKLSFSPNIRFYIS